MVDIFALDTVDGDLAFAWMESAEYKEFSRILEEIDSLLDEENLDLMLEATRVQRAPVVDAVKDAKNIAKNTMGTIRDVQKVHGAVTDAGGEAVRAGWNMAAALVNLIVRGVSFIVKHLAKIPDMIAKVLNKLADLPSDIYNKIKGNIKLYITVPDIELLYRERLFTKLDGFLASGKRLAQGNAWNYVKGAAIVKKIKKIFTETDDAVCKQILAYYREIGKVRFEHTLIDMSNRGNVVTYLSAQKKISFVDARGQKFTGNYYQCLEKLVRDLIDRQKEIQGTFDMLTAKYNSTQASLNFAELSKQEQQLIVSTINAMSSMVSLVGNIIKYVMTDMQEIYKNLNSVNARNLRKQGVNVVDKKTAKAAKKDLRQQKNNP